MQGKFELKTPSYLSLTDSAGKEMRRVDTGVRFQAAAPDGSEKFSANLFFAVRNHDGTIDHRFTDFAIKSLESMNRPDCQHAIKAVRSALQDTDASDGASLIKAVDQLTRMVDEACLAACAVSSGVDNPWDLAETGASFARGVYRGRAPIDRERLVKNSTKGSKLQWAVTLLESEVPSTVPTQTERTKTSFLILSHPAPAFEVGLNSIAADDALQPLNDSYLVRAHGGAEIWPGELKPRLFVASRQLMGDDTRGLHAASLANSVHAELISAADPALRREPSGQTLAKRLSNATYDQTELYKAGLGVLLADDDVF